MKSKSSRRSIVLFITVIVLPALLLSIVTLRMFRQERELFEKRAGDERKRTAMEIGEILLVRLEELKNRSVRFLDSEPDAFRRRAGFPIPIVFVGKWRDMRLIFPWGLDANGASKGNRPEDGEIERILRPGEEKEFRDHDLSKAAELYRQAAVKARGRKQQTASKLALARVLNKSDHVGEARTLYEAILEESTFETDEFGIPYRLFAAERFAALGGDVRKAFVALDRITGGREWLSLPALHMAKGIVEGMSRSLTDPAAVADVSALSDRLIRDIAIVEQSSKLRAETENRAEEISGNEALSAGISFWSFFGEHPWLYSSSERSSSPDSYLFVLDGPTVLVEILQENRFKTRFPGTARLSSGRSASGESLGSAFPGVRLQFDENSAVMWLNSRPPGPVITWLALFLVIGATAFGLALILRDVRRESRTAAMRSQLVSNVSHELKTPLTSIRMFAESLLLDWVPDPGNQKEYLQTIVGESERLSRLINNVLDFSKIEQGTRAYHMTPISLPDVVRKTVRTMDFPLRQEGFDLRLEIDDGIPEIEADGDALEQAVLNLLNNAMKYSGASREIGLRLRRDGDEAVLEIEDKGLGIKPEDQGKIFDKFIRGDAGEKVRIPGTGLGLTIVRHIVEAHKGRIDLVSRLGEGSRFTLRIPLEKPS